MSHYSFINKLQLKRYYTEPTDNYNIVSSVIFRLEDNYKPMNEYYNKLEKFIKIFKETFVGFYFRIYFDNSIIKHTDNKLINEEIDTIWRPLLIKLKKLSFVQLCWYEHKDFLKSKNFHKGVFGTIIRFIPIFDYEFNNNIDIIIISDVDVNHKYLNYTKKSLTYCIDNKLRFFFRTSYCKHSSGYHTVTAKLVNTWLRVMAGTVIINKFKFPIKIIDLFFNQLYTKNYDEHLLNFINLKEFSIHTHKTKTELIFKYGIDEVFSMYLLEYIINNKIIFGYVSQKDIDSPIYFWAKKNNMLKDENNPKYKEILKHLLKHHYNEELNYNNNYQFYEDEMYIFHTNNNPTKLQLELLANTFEFFNYINDKKLFDHYGFTKLEVNCVLKQQHIITDFHSVNYTNTQHLL